MKMRAFFALVAMVVGSAHADEFSIETRTDRLGQPEGGSIGSQWHSSVSAEAGDADGKARLILTHLPKEPKAGRYFRTQFKASVPFNRDKQDQADIGSLAKISAGTSVGLEWSYVDWKPVERERVDQIIKVCGEYFGKLVPDYSESLLALGGYNQGCSIEGLTDTEALRKAAAQVNTLRKECAKTPNTTSCSKLLAISVDAKVAANAEAIQTELQPSLVAAIDNAVNAVNVWTLGVAGNQQEFKFVLPGAPANVVEERERGWSASFAFTRVYQNSMWTLGFSHEEAFEGGQKAEICTPFGTAGALTCSERSVGAPTEKTTELLFTEYRYLASSTLGISPRIEFDAEKSQWGIRVPFYLVRNRDDQLTAGIVVGWDEENDGGAAVFVGKPFRFLD